MLPLIPPLPIGDEPLITEDGEILLLEQGHRASLAGSQRLENPQETMLGLAQYQGVKYDFLLGFGFVPVGMAWSVVYNERGITLPLVENPVMRAFSTYVYDETGSPLLDESGQGILEEASPGGGTVTAARVFVLFHVGQFHSGNIVAFTAGGLRGNQWPQFPPENEWTAGDALLMGKVRQLVTCDSYEIFRTARMFGKMLRPPPGFFWDAYESSDDSGPDSLEASTTHVDLFDHPTLDRVALIVTNRDSVPAQVVLDLNTSDYPELVGKTRVSDVSSGEVSSTFNISGGLHTALTIPADTTKGYIIS